MTLRRKLGIAGIILFAIVALCCFASDTFRAYVYFGWRAAYLAVHPDPPRCKARAVDLQARVELIQRDAKNSLKVGTKKDDLVHFFASENIPLSFSQIGQSSEATGTISFKGLPECANIACGDDSALIGIRVKVDVDGTVISDPTVTGMYTDCL